MVIKLNGFCFRNYNYGVCDNISYVNLHFPYCDLYKTELKPCGKIGTSETFIKSCRQCDDKYGQNYGSEAAVRDVIGEILDAANQDLMNVIYAFEHQQLRESFDVLLDEDK